MTNDLAYLFTAIFGQPVTYLSGGLVAASFLFGLSLVTNYMLRGVDFEEGGK